MSGTIPPIPPPLGTSSGNPISPNVNRVDTMPTTTDPINAATATNVSQSVVEENIPQLLDSRGGSHVINVPAFDKEDFTSWKVRFLVFLDGLEPYLLKNLEDGPFVPISSLSTYENPLPKRQNQYIKEMWNDLILTHEGPSDTRDTKIDALRLKFIAFKSLESEKDSDSDVEEDQRTSNEFMADLNAKYHERALLTNQKRILGKNEKGKSEKGLIAKSFDWDEESVSLEDEQTTLIRAFMEIAEDGPSVGKADARSGQWVNITMKKVHRLLSMTNGDERKHVLDYTHVDLHYVVDQKKNLVNKFNLLKQELSLHKSELCNLKNILSINCSLQNEVIRVNLENESLKDEISDLKKALGGRGKRKEKISSKEVIFTKADESSSLSIPEITSDSESECETQEPLPKLKGVAPAGTSDSLISLSDLTLNMADLTLDTSVPKKTRPTSVKVSPAYVIKRKTENKLPAVPKSCSNKKADSFTKQLLLTLMEQCSTCGSTDHLTKEHLEHAAVKKNLIKLKAQSPLNPTPKKAPMIPKPFKDCKYYGFNDHHSNNCEYYPGCKVCGSVAHEPTDCHKKHPNSKRPRIANKQSTKPTENGCSRNMTVIKQYLHRYLKESAPKVVFGDDSSRDTKGYGLVNCNGITFTRLKEPFSTKMMKLSSLLQEEEMSIRMENLNEVRVKELRSDNGTKFKNHKLEDFCDKKEEDLLISATVHIHNHRDHLGKFNEKADDGFFLDPLTVINFSLTKSKATQCFGNIEYFPYILAYENITPVDSLIPQDSVSHTDPPEFTEADNHPTLNELDQHEYIIIPYNLAQNYKYNVIIEPISDIQSSPTTISPTDIKIIPSKSLFPQDNDHAQKHSELD
ncbi:hypothetical protein Tco_1346850 [Tanacetum coccineum]